MRALDGREDAGEQGRGRAAWPIEWSDRVVFPRGLGLVRVAGAGRTRGIVGEFSSPVKKKPPAPR